MATFPDPADALVASSFSPDRAGARHRAPEEARPGPLGGPRHRIGDDAVQLRIAAPEDRARSGRHAAAEEDDAAGPWDAADAEAARDGDEDPIAWMGFRFEAV